MDVTLFDLTALPIVFRIGRCKIGCRRGRICKIAFGNACPARRRVRRGIPPVACIFKRHACKRSAIIERISSDTRHAVWNSYACKRRAVIERLRLDTLHAVRYDDACERTTTTECTHSDICHAKYERCGWERCKINVRNGRIYNCPSSEFADLFNGYFGEKLVVTPSDYLIIDETLTRERIDEFKNPMPFCNQCNLEARSKKLFHLEPSKRRMEEWADARLYEAK